MSKIIEFYGPPGLGKTALAEIALQYLNKRGIESIDWRERRYLGYKKWLKEAGGKKIKYPTEKRIILALLDFLPAFLKRRLIGKSNLFLDTMEYERCLIQKFIIENPKIFSLIIKNIDENNYFKDKEKVLDRYFRLFVKYQETVQITNQDLIIFDEAFCQRILGIYSYLFMEDLTYDYEKDLKYLLNLVSFKIDLVFYIQSSPKKCFKRQKKRGAIIGEYSNEKERLKDLKIMNKNSQIIHETLLDNGVKSFKIDNNGTLKDAKEQLYPCLDEIIENLEENED